MTANDLIRWALLDLQVVGQGEVVSAEDASDGLDILNGMIDSWQADELMIFSTTLNKFTLTANKQTYTLGPGGDFSMTRPARIEHITFIDNVLNPVQPIELPLDILTVQKWSAIPVKSVSNQYPGKVWDDQGYPLRTLSVWPIPTINIQIGIYAWVPLSSFADLTTVYTFPPGYQECLRSNLAVRMAAPWGLPQAPPSVQQAAITTYERVKAMNLDLVDLRCDPAVATADNRLFAWIDFISGR